ncbi:MAG: MurT ligase domain-containing protein [Chloroflexota bacterium]|nr:MurT ligase domain-containing protein [Chloroflexota bacterium]
MATTTTTPRRRDVRLTLAMAAAKATSGVIRRAGRGGGTAAPGLVADRLDDALLGKLVARLPGGAVVIAGTNGKTTVSRMVADVLEAGGARVLHNRSGSNLVRGVVAAFADQATVGGDPRADIAVIEADEAALPEIVRRVRPRVVLLNNLFRDQLDRYGEIDAIATAWARALAALPAGATVVVNADDPALATITTGIAARRITFGLDESRFRLDALPHAADAATCRLCGADLVYDALYVSHLGAWRCPNGDTVRPPLDVVGHDIDLQGVDALAVSVTAGPAPPVRLTVAVPGLYNAYNVVATAAVAHALGRDPGEVVRGLAAFRAAFGRIERVGYRDRTLILALVKNPTGFNEVLRMLTVATGGLTVPTMIAINDLAADGRDVSWLWDVDFELLAGGDTPLATTGIRGTDMANRLKYAGVGTGRIRTLPPDARPALEAFVDSIPEGGTGYILPTYTAMLDLRRVLASLGAVETFWRQ